MEKKYVVWPDYVRSKTDGQEHFISFRQLCHLYGVNPAECYDASMVEIVRGIDRTKLIDLMPRYDGNYTLPTKED